MLLMYSFGIPPEYQWLSGCISGGLLVAAILGWFYRQEINKVKELRERLGESAPDAVYRNLSDANHIPFPKQSQTPVMSHH